MRVFTVSVFFLSFFFLRTSIHRRVQLRRHAADWSVFYEWPPLWAISLAAMALKAPIETSIDLLPSKFTSSKKKEEKSRKNRFQLDKTLVTTMKRKRNGSRPFYFFLIITRINLNLGYLDGCLERIIQRRPKRSNRYNTPVLFRCRWFLIELKTSCAVTFFARALNRNRSSMFKDVKLGKLGNGQFRGSPSFLVAT